MIRVIYIVQAWSSLLDCSRHTDCAKDQIIHFSLNTDFYRIFSDFNLTVRDQIVHEGKMTQSKKSFVLKSISAHKACFYVKLPKVG